MELTEGQKLVQQYRERFGHAVPMAAFLVDPFEAQAKLKEALATGKPVPGWATMNPLDFEPKTPERSSSDSESLVVQVLESKQSKDPKLAAKQRHLLQILSKNSSSAPRKG